eukprot:2923070-Rhodomonas_salina.3
METKEDLMALIQHFVLYDIPSGHTLASLRTRYAIPGTDLSHVVMASYERAVRCPVLSFSMLLWLCPRLP